MIEKSDHPIDKYYTPGQIRIHKQIHLGFRMRTFSAFSFCIPLLQIEYTDVD